MTMEITPNTAFYALVADVPGYTLEEQVLGGLTLREWLKAHSGQDAEGDLACELENMADEGGIYLDEAFAKQVLADGVDRILVTSGHVEAFTPAELLNRLRLEAMDEPANMDTQWPLVVAVRCKLDEAWHGDDPLADVPGTGIGTPPEPDATTPYDDMQDREDPTITLTQAQVLQLWKSNVAQLNVYIKKRYRNGYYSEMAREWCELLGAPASWVSVLVEVVMGDGN